MKAQGTSFTPTSSWTGHLNSGALVSLSVIETIRACISPHSWCPCSGENLEKGVCSEKNCESGSLGYPSAVDTQMGRRPERLWP